MRKYPWRFIRFLCWSALIIGAGSFAGVTIIAGVTISSEFSSVDDQISTLKDQTSVLKDRIDLLELSLAVEQGKWLALRGLAVCNLSVLRSLGGDEANEWFAECVEDQVNTPPLASNIIEPEIAPTRSR